MANERTYLAWVRTGITIMALGFVVAKFGIIIRELVPGAPAPSYHLFRRKLRSASTCMKPPAITSAIPMADDRCN